MAAMTEAQSVREDPTAATPQPAEHVIIFGSWASAGAAMCLSACSTSNTVNRLPAIHLATQASTMRQEPAAAAAAGPQPTERPVIFGFCASTGAAMCLSACSTPSCSRQAACNQAWHMHAV